MTDPARHPIGQSIGQSIGLRELRHRTTEVMARVKRGETIDVTDHGQPVARLVPVSQQRTPVLDRLSDEGRLRPAIRPGYRPRPRADVGADLLSDAVAAMRDDGR